jgi:hypothetical protein
VLRLLVSVSVVPISAILDTLMMEAICFSETSVVLTRATRRNIPEGGILRNREPLHLKRNRIRRVSKKGNTIIVKDLRVSQDCGTSRHRNFLDIRLRNGVKVFGLMHHSLIIPRKIPHTQFCLSSSEPQRPMWLEELVKLKKISEEILGNQPHLLPACNSV